MKLLVTGANGQVGWQLQRTLAPLGEVVAVDQAEVDFLNPDQAAAAVAQIRPDVLVNPGAYTAVDKAESEPELARLINAVAPGRMARALARTGGLFIHYSTDYVFDGSKAEPYTEEDPTGPLSVYGQTKLEGEQAVAESGCAYLIFRTSWVYDIRGKNFLRTVLRLARQKETLHMVDDQHGAPTWARALAEATAAIIAKVSSSSGAQSSRPGGLYHLTAGGETTWAGFARAIIQEYNELLAWPVEPGEFGIPLLAKQVVGITSSEFKTPARRPSNSRLSNEKLQRDFGIRLPDWRHLLRLALLGAVVP